MVGRETHLLMNCEEGIVFHYNMTEADTFRILKRSPIGVLNDAIGYERAIRVTGGNWWSSAEERIEYEITLIMSHGWTWAEYQQEGKRVIIENHGD